MGVAPETAAPPLDEPDAVRVLLPGRRPGARATAAAPTSCWRTGRRARSTRRAAGRAAVRLPPLYPRGGGETLLVVSPGPLLPARRSAHLGIRGPALRGALARELGDRRPRGSGAPRALDAQPRRRRRDGEPADGADAGARRSSRARTTRRAAATATRCSCASRSCPAGTALPGDLRARLTNAGTALNRERQIDRDAIFRLEAGGAGGAVRALPRRAGLRLVLRGRGAGADRLRDLRALAERHGKDWRQLAGGLPAPRRRRRRRLPRRGEPRASASTPGRSG